MREATTDSEKEEYIITWLRAVCQSRRERKAWGPIMVEMVWENGEIRNYRVREETTGK